MDYFKKPVLSLLVILIASLAFSVSRLSAETESKAEDKPSHQLESYFRFVPSRSVDARAGKVEIIEADAEYSYEFKAFEKLPVTFSIGNNYIGIEDSLDNLELPAHLVGLTTDLETTLPFCHFNKTYLRIGISPSFYGDEWAFSSSDFRIPSRYFLIYQPNDKWTFLYGVALYPEFEYDVLPILGFIYKPNDKLTFNIVPERPNITYSLNERVSLFAEGGSSFSEYEVTRDNSKSVVLRYKEVHLGGGVKFKLNEYIRASVSSGGMFNRQLKYKDDQGKVGIKDGLYTEFRIEIRS